MDELLVKQIRHLVKNHYASEVDALGRKFYKYHIKAMLPIAQALAPIHEADEETIVLATLLHTFPAERAKELLLAHQYPEGKIENVVSKQAECIADAINVSATLDVSALYYQAYHQQNLGLAEGVQWVQEQLKKAWDQVQKPSQDHFQTTYDTIQELFHGIKHRRYCFGTSLENKLAELSEAACKSEHNAFGYGIWENHISPMVSIADDLAVLHGADSEVVRIATLLHDLASIEDFALSEEHHIHGARRARQILTEAGYPADKTDLVAQCILHHRGSVLLPKATAEEQCLSDADAVAHMSDLPSLLYVAFGRRKIGYEQGTEWVRKKIKRDWNKMSALARSTYAQKYESILLYL